MSKQSPFISIIIPSYNHALYLKEAITSVLNQSYSHFELIIIDDASQDDSWQCIQQFDDSRIKAIRHKKNIGAAPTINEGLAQAEGDYLTVLNSDDSYHLERLARFVQLKKDFIVSDIQLFDAESNNNDIETRWINWFDELKSQYQKSQDFLATLLKGNFLITTSNFFFSREIYQQFGGFQDYRYIHDYAFALKALLEGKTIYFEQEKLLNYRLHDANTIREAPQKAIWENSEYLLGLFNQYPDVFMTNQNALSSLMQHLQNVYRYNNGEWNAVLHKQIVAKEKELFALIEDRDQWIAERDRWLKDREEIIQSKDQKIVEQDSWIRDRDLWIEERDSWISDRDDIVQALQQKSEKQLSTIAQQQEQLNQQKTLIAHQQQWISDRDEWISERDTVIAKQQEWIADRDDWIAERDALIKQLKAEITALRNSRSYRLGQAVFVPLHPLKRIIKGEHYA